jgi:hypothetical protein
MWSRPTSTTRSRHDSRDRKRAYFARTGLEQHARARIERRARRAHVVDEHHDTVMNPGVPPERERISHIRVPLRGRQVCL